MASSPYCLICLQKIVRLVSLPSGAIAYAASTLRGPSCYQESARWRRNVAGCSIAGMNGVLLTTEKGNLLSDPRPETSMD